MGQALYRSYRSRDFDEVVGQDHVVQTLKSAIKAGRISHAYLFTGPRGVGKTSVARILAREVNGLSYEGENTHLDIIEIDAASNRRIDEIRELRDKVHITPTSSKYKVYIIDEVHMLTREAFNALLKTLEEPPAHAIFILATTEAHKLPETITSRTQRFNFKPINQADAIAHLARIAKSEKIKADADALELIATHGEGSFRDSISLLDQLASGREVITAEMVRRQLGLPRDITVNNLLAAIKARQPGKVSEILAEARAETADAPTLAKSLAAAIRQNTKGTYDSDGLALLKNLLAVTASAQSDELLEISLLEAALVNQSGAEMITDTEPIVDKPVKQGRVSPKDEQSGNFDLAMWQDVTEETKRTAAPLYTALRLAVPVIENDKLILYFEFPLHQKKLNHAAAKAAIADIIETVSGARIPIDCQVDKDVVRRRPGQQEADFYKTDASSGDMEAISNIFGSVEMLES